MPSDAVQLNQRFVAQARQFSRASAVVVTLVGVLVLAGWQFDVEILKGPYGGITMKANAAIAFVFAGASLGLLNAGWPSVWRGRLGQSFGFMVGLIGAATLTQHVTGWDLRIDQLLFTEAAGATATASPGRMGPPASICLALIGLALILLHRGRYAGPAQVAALGAGMAALMAITGYAYGVETLYGVARFTGVALQAAVALLVLSVGLLAASVDRGIGSVFAGVGAGSVMARRLLLIAIVVPLSLGWLEVRLQVQGYFDSRFSIAALILTIIAVLTIIIIRTAIRLNRIEEQQRLAEAGVRDRLHEIETIMEVLPIGVFITTDQYARQITGNRAAREFLRLPNSGTDISLGAPPPAAPTHFRAFHEGVEVPVDALPMQRAAREGVVVKDLELDIVFADGEVRRELISARPLLDDHGNTRGAVASTMDITARVAIEKEREELLAKAQKAREEAEAASRSKDEFLANVSHELRTPLNAILGWASILREGIVVNEEVRQQALATIERNCKAQVQLVEDLLDVSRITASRLLLDVRPVDMVGVVNAAIDAIRPQADAREIQLCTKLDRNGPVIGDPTRLQQVFWNLLSNSVKFSPTGSTVEVRLTADQHETTISVTDAGEGIDPEFLPYVFDRFRQADSKKTRRYGGLGLGLSIARDLVEMHDGTIEAVSDGLGRGACFIVRLPAGHS